MGQSKEVQSPCCTPATITRALPGVVACVFWSVASSAIILLNKHLLSVHHFQAPMVLCSLGMIFSSVATFLLCRVLRVVPTPNVDKVDLAFYCKYILPAGCAMAGNLALGNYTFVYLPVTYVQMLKSLAPAVNYVALVLLDMEKVSAALVTSVSLIVLGTAAASYGEVAFNSTGMALYLGAELCEVARVVIMQVMTQQQSFSPMEGLYVMAPTTVFWLLCGIVVFESRIVVEHNLFAKMEELPLLYMLAGTLGFCVNISTWAVIKSTSALTLKVVGTSKNAATVWFGAMLFGSVVTPMQIWGYGLSLFGFGLYNLAKAMPNLGQGAPKPPPSPMIEGGPDDLENPAPLSPAAAAAAAGNLPRLSRIL
mmetsp:Transcript_19817/g.43338  ORF Transcript_19817/g.43338 Transcript_19817/m.43338 type:complete len:367 (-) Transcript_19817:863-1963(-)